MKPAIQIELSYAQILSIVKQLPLKQKIQLSKELEKEATNKKLTRLLNEFGSDNLDLNIIAEEAESVRQEIYETKRNQSHI